MLSLRASPLFSALWFATTKIGAIAVSAQKSLLPYAIEDTLPRVVIMDASYQDQLPSSGRDLLYIVGETSFQHKRIYPYGEKQDPSTEWRSFDEFLGSEEFVPINIQLDTDMAASINYTSGRYIIYLFDLY